ARPLLPHARRLALLPSRRILALLLPRVRRRRRNSLLLPSLNPSVPSAISPSRHRRLHSLDQPSRRAAIAAPSPPDLPVRRLGPLDPVLVAPVLHQRFLWIRDLDPLLSPSPNGIQC
uniref:Uncharacterized protein n=1 Tax=Oryza glumipatula TaxID=40148 RepID=A0A0E0B054_9ORYZ